MHLILLLSSPCYPTGPHLHYPWHSDFILHYTGVYTERHCIHTHCFLAGRLARCLLYEDSLDLLV